MAGWPRFGDRGDSLLATFTITASASFSPPPVALGGVPLSLPAFPAGIGEPELGVPPGRFVVWGTVAVGIVPSDGVIVASEQGPIWLRPVGPGLDRLLSAVQVLDYGKVRLRTRDPGALDLVRWRVDMPGRVDLRQRSDGAVLISSDGEQAGILRAQATHQATAPCPIPRIPLGDDQVLSIDPAELLCDGVLRLDDVDGTIDLENLGDSQTAICNVFTFPPSAECTQIEPPDLGLDGPSNRTASARAIGRCSGLIRDPEFDRGAIRTSGFENCTNSVTRKLAISIERRRKFLFISHWGKFAKRTIVRPPGNPFGLIPIDVRKRCRGLGRQQYRSVLRGLAAFSDGMFGGAAARSDNEPRITC